VLLLLAATGKALAANSRSLVVGGCCCCASLACSLRLAFSSFPSLTTAHWCAPRCLSASCGALALAANSRSLVVGCCFSGVAADSASCGTLALAANSRSLVVGCCLSGVAAPSCNLPPFTGSA